MQTRPEVLRRLADEYGQPPAGICHRLIRALAACAGLLAATLGLPAAALAHGGVVMEEDQCVIDIGLFRAHFTIYQPQTRASEEFCEDVPDLGETIFVMDYLHDSLRGMPVEFRIIRDVHDSRSYARWDDVQAIEDLEAATVFHELPRIEPGGSLTARHVFEDEGWYIGVVTTEHPTIDKEYNAVFGFHVGGRGLGYWPLLLLLAAVVQLHFWISSGGFRRWRARSKAAGEEFSP